MIPLKIPFAKISSNRRFCIKQKSYLISESAEIICIKAVEDKFVKTPII